MVNVQFNSAPVTYWILKKITSLNVYFKLCLNSSSEQDKLFEKENFTKQRDQKSDLHYVILKQKSIRF